MTNEQEEPETIQAGTSEQGSDAWQTELPPEDDFHDQPESAASMTEESETIQNPFEGVGASPKKNTKPVVVIAAVAVLFAGVFAFLQFGGEKAENSQSLPFNASQETKQQEPKQEQAAPKQDVQQQSFENTSVSSAEAAQAEINAIYNAGLSKTTAPEPTKVPLPGVPDQLAMVEKPAGMKAGMSEVMAFQPAQPAQAEQPAPLAMPGQIEKASPVQGGEQVPQKADATAPRLLASGEKAALPSASAPALPVSGDSSAFPQALGQSPVELQVKELSQQVDALKQSLQRLTEQTSALGGRLDTVLAAQPAAGGQGSDLNNRLNQLEQQLANLSQKKTKETRLESPGTEQKMAVEQSAGVVITDEAVKKKAAPSKPAPAKQRTARKTVAKAEVRRPSKSWVLRAATPDAAWVSESHGSTELRQVQIGDNLPGIGVVRSIQQRGDAWVVEGSKGTIR